MPIDEGTPSAAAGQNTNTNSTPPTSSVSDLGELLIDKSLENIQNKDFVPVSKNDIVNFLGANDSTQPTSSDTRSTEANTTSTDSTQANEIADISNIAEIPVATEIPVVEETPTIQTPVVEETTTVENTTPTIETPMNTEQITTETTNTSFDPFNILGTPGVTESTSTAEEEVVTTSTSTTEIPVIEEIAIAENTNTPSTDTNANTTNNTTNTEIGDDPFASITLDQPATEENTEPVVDLPVDDISNIAEIPNVTEIPVVEETATAENTDATTPIVDDMSTITLDEPVSENSTEISNIPSTENSAEISVPTNTEPLPIPTEEVSITSPIPTENVEPVVDLPMPDAIEIPTTTNPVSDALSSLQATISTPDIAPENNVSSTPQTIVSPENIPVENTAPVNSLSSAEKSNLETIANDITQGIDLDSLLPDSNATQTTVNSVNTTPTVTPTAVEEHHDTTPDAQKKKKMLLILGAVAFLGLVFFGIQLMNGGSSTDNDTTLTPPTETVTSGDNNTLPPIDGSGDETDESVTPPDDITDGSGDISSGSNDTSTGSNITDPVDTTPTITQEGLLSEGQTLLGKVKKALIQATLKKNGPLRLSAFELQKDVQAFVQTLENTSDISNLEESANTLKDFSKRLDGILQKLNGSSQ